MKPTYQPSGRAKEYGDLAINVYTGCNHGCTYCYAPLVLKRERNVFHSNVELRKGIVEAVKRQLDVEQTTGKLIHLCFTCDPYPAAKSLKVLYGAKQCGIKTWVSCEPVYDVEMIYWLIRNVPEIDLFKIGKLNYALSDINWREFGRECERLCQLHNRNYYIKEDLRKLM